MGWLAPLIVRLHDLGPWAPVVFILLYIAGALIIAPVFLLTVAAGAIFGVWEGSLLVFIAASLGATAVYAVVSPLGHSRLMRRLTRDPRVSAVREAVVGEGLWIMFLLRLSPLVPYSVLNYALALSGVRFADFVIALVGMIPAIIMYTYYGLIVGDVAALVAGVAPPRGAAYYSMLIVGLVAIVVSTTMIAKAARSAVERQQRSDAQG